MRRLLDVNLTGVFNCCRSAGRVMPERGRGSIVAVSSVHGSVGLGGRRRTLLPAVLAWLRFAVVPLAQSARASTRRRRPSMIRPSP